MMKVYKCIRWRMKKEKKCFKEMSTTDWLYLDWICLKYYFLLAPPDKDENSMQF